MPRVPRSPRSLLLRLAIVAAGTVAGLGLAEASLRLFWEKPEAQALHHQLFCEYDPVLGWRKLGSFTGRLVTREYRVTERFNSKGLRGPEYAYDRPAGVYRILVLGDSSAEGYGVDFEQLFSRRLESELARRSRRKVEVINAGTGGYSTDQELLFFEREGEKYHPDLTLLLFHDNDVWFNGQDRYWRAFKPRFVLANGELVLTNVPPPRSPPNPPGAAVPGAAGGARGWLLAHSYLGTLAREALHAWPPLHRLASALGIAGSPAGTSAIYPPPVEWLVYRKDEPPAVAAAWRVTEALLARLTRDTAAAGSSLLVFHVPVAEALDPDRRRAQLAAYGLDPAAWDVGRGLAGLQAICARNGIALVDPAGMERSAAGAEARGERLYYRVDMHWNAAGHRAAAEVLADHIAPILR